jgi:hypothetical protein
LPEIALDAYAAARANCCRQTFLGEAVNDVTADIERSMWLRGRGRRFYLHGRVNPAVTPSFALPGGNAP